MMRAILNNIASIISGEATYKATAINHQQPITKIIKVRRTRHSGQCCRSRDKLISDILLWTPSYGRAKA